MPPGVTYDGGNAQTYLVDASLDALRTRVLARGIQDLQEPQQSQWSLFSNAGTGSRPLRVASAFRLRLNDEFFVNLVEIRCSGLRA